jgi:hypothetical protein
VPKSLYLINPRADGASYFGAEVFEYAGFARAQGIADLATATVAALAPPDWDVSVCDEYITPVDFDCTADFIGITGKVTQASRMLSLTEEFRRRGKTVIVGGPYASLTPHMFRGRCDILVTGELETIAPKFFFDLEHGTWKAEYAAGKADLAASPMPRWDLYPTERALIGCVQTSRGCPFECEFCDVIQYLGRQQRIKPVPKVLAELDVLYGHGFRAVFFADDNFTVYRRRAKETLAALRDWNRTRPTGPMAFSAQISIDAARDPELLQLLAEAGMTWVFIGLETPNQESLRETKKRQNVGVDLLQHVQRFMEHGISVTGGMMVGFDHDGPDIFERQFEFAMASPIPIFSLGALVAPAATPLFERMQRAGRLVNGGSEVAASPWDTNIVPAKMSREELFIGLRWLCERLYAPENFGRRVLQMVDALRPAPGVADVNGAAPLRPIESEALVLIEQVLRRGPEERKMCAAVFRAMQTKPFTGKLVMAALYRYAQIRCMYETAGFLPAMLEPNSEPLFAIASGPAVSRAVQ